MKLPLVSLLFLLPLALVASTSPTYTDGEGRPTYTVTLRPLCRIFEQLTGNTEQIHCLLPPGASPHFFEPRPSDVKKAAASIGFFYVASNLDGWLVGLQKDSQKRIALLDLLPKSFQLKATNSNDSGPIDPHFWMDPLAIRALLPKLAGILCRFEPKRCAHFQQHQREYAQKLSQLHQDILKGFQQTGKKAILTSHPFLNYFVRRYQIGPVKSIQRSAHHPPQPRHLKEVLQWGQIHQVKVVITSPQLPKKAAQMVVEYLGAKSIDINPLGGTQNTTYEQMLSDSAQTILRALR